jgi:hypothetical protein
VTWTTVWTAILLAGCGAAPASGGAGDEDPSDPQPYIPEDHLYSATVDVGQLEFAHGADTFAIVALEPESEGACVPSFFLGNRNSGPIGPGAPAVGATGVMPPADDFYEVPWTPVWLLDRALEDRVLFDGGWTITQLDARAVVIEVSGAEVCEVQAGLGMTENDWFDIIENCFTSDVTLRWTAEDGDPDLPLDLPAPELDDPGAWTDLDGNVLCGALAGR